MDSGRILKILGLMSGTSLDGVDAALLETDGERIFAFGSALTIPYPAGLREALRAILGRAEPSAEIREVERAMTLAHAEAVRALLEKSGLSPASVDLVGFHGHTILHRPKEGRTWQIGDGDLLAKTVGIDVVRDFRSADVAAGGQGAPLVPLFHAALCRERNKPLAVLNIGGVANITFVGADGALLAFDTGPGNALIDDWAHKHNGQPVDMDGALAKKGRIDARALNDFVAHPFFAQAAPKSLDRNDFRHFAEDLVADLSAEDGAATLTAFTAAAVDLAQAHLPRPPGEWLVCGGGRRNPEIMKALRERLPAPVRPVDEAGWDGDALEAQAFAYLAARSVRGLPLTLPSTTGVARPTCGGRLCPAA